MGALICCFVIEIVILTSDFWLTFLIFYHDFLMILLPASFHDDGSPCVQVIGCFICFCFTSDGVWYYAPYLLEFERFRNQFCNRCPLCAKKELRVFSFLFMLRCLSRLNSSIRLSNIGMASVTRI